MGIVGQFNKGFLFVWLLAFLSGCGALPSLLTGEVPRLTQNGVMHESGMDLHIGWPNLSPDGRYLVFDFYTRKLARKKSPRSPMVLVLYDLKKRTLEYLRPSDKNLFFWHSPSFDPNGRYLTFISSCPFRICRPEQRGSQIGLYDLKEQNFSQVTDALHGHDLWFEFGEELRLKHIQKSGAGLIRGAPVFSPDNKFIYYSINPLASFSSVFSEQALFNYQIRRVRLGDFSCIPDCPEEPAMQEDRGAVLFEGDGRIARVGENRLVFSGTRPLGKKREYYKANQPAAFFYDLKTEEIESVFKAHQIYPHSTATPKLAPRYISSLTASSDGKKIGFISSQNTVFTIWQDGVFRDAFSAFDAGSKRGRVRHTVISGNGNWAVILTNPNKNNKHNEQLWLLNLKNNTREELPLTSLLRQSLPMDMK